MSKNEIRDNLALAFAYASTMKELGCEYISHEYLDKGLDFIIKTLKEMIKEVG